LKRFSFISEKLADVKLFFASFQARGTGGDTLVLSADSSSRSDRVPVLGAGLLSDATLDQIHEYFLWRPRADFMRFQKILLDIGRPNNY
jgi:hypothetical protein